ncbi:MAG: cytochrome b N-terminal domain-containing protein, partial [Nitrospirota bacterium]
LILLAFAFTGYLLPWDQTAYWATQVGINMVGTVPLIGGFLIKVLRAGETLGALTLTRFFAVHVLFLPALMIIGVAVHLFILRRVGPAGPWNAEKAHQKSEAFWPRQVYMDSVVMVGVFLLLVSLAYFLPFPLADKADPADHSFVPVPEWYFLFFYQLLKYASGPLEPVASWMLPALFIGVLLFLPFLDRRSERHPAKRPLVMVAGVGFLVIVFGLLGISLKNLYAIPKSDPSVVQGQKLFAQHHCAACHRIHGEGGKVGPDLSFVGDRRPDRDWHLRHFTDPQSVSPGSIMPKFPLSDKEKNDLASYMLSLKSL